MSEIPGYTNSLEEDLMHICQITRKVVSWPFTSGHMLLSGDGDEHVEILAILIIVV